MFRSVHDPLLVDVVDVALNAFLKLRLRLNPDAVQKGSSYLAEELFHQVAPRPVLGVTARLLVGLRFAAAVVVLGLGVMAAGCGQSHTPANTLRVGVLKFGTVSWEMAVVQARHLAAERGVHLKVVPFASKNALGVALHGGRVDLIVSDWLWAARQHAEGWDYQFVPYSLAVGALIVNPDSGIKKVADLAGHKIGIAGGPVNKTWLLLRAYAARTAGVDLKKAAKPTFAAPPIINALMNKGKLPAAINYWQYNARAKAAGMTSLITVKTMLDKLGVHTEPPLLGWVFEAHWADTHGDILRSFLAASYQAKDILRDSDQAWIPIRDLVKPGSDAEFAAIKARYRAGIPTHYGKPEIAAARKLFRILAQPGGAELTGGMKRLPKDLFWDGFRLQ